MQFALVFNTKEEFDDAAALIAAKRGGAAPSSDSDQSSLVQKLVAALSVSPLNPQKATILKTWLAAPDGEWVLYAKVIQAFADAGLATKGQESPRAAAALRDLSWQVAQTLTRGDLAQYDKAIEALASRSRSGGAYSYRLTPAGRTATELFLSKETI
jgi:hypothetical protein